MSGAAGAAGTAAAAAIAQAIKAAGAIVKLDPGEFQQILLRVEEPLVVHRPPARFRGKHHQYLITYKGFFFHTKSATALTLPEGSEVVKADSIYVPT